MTTDTKLQRVGSGESTVINPPDNISLESESKKLPSSQYKGVVPQPNGRWGAQIYEKHQRVWLGTFNLESDAARAYDVAAQRFRGRDAVTNFKPLSESDESDLAELEFLNFHSKAEIVDMLRKHTYNDELLQKKYTTNSMRGKNSSNFIHSSEKAPSLRREHLFEKTVTPSDVGKLNRLVIPKQHAQKHFPLQISHDDGGAKGILLNFEDGIGKVWRFRYSYWNSSQSYVLTKGWSRFVKEKRLQAGDVVSFQQYYLGEDKNDRQLYIECKPKAKPIQVVRLFGVNIFKVDGLEKDDDNGRKRSSNGDLNLFLKKHCVGALYPSC